MTQKSFLFEYLLEMATALGNFALGKKVSSRHLLMVSNLLFNFLKQ